MLIAERDLLASTWKDYIYLENEPVVRIDKSSTNVDTLNFYHADHLGTPVAMTNASGTVILRTEYFPFGKVYSQTGSGTNNLRFPGQYFDTETSLHYNWWRYYWNRIGRFYTVDPIGIKGGVNGYEYSRNNPIMNFDPEGLSSSNKVPGADWKKKCADAKPISRTDPRACKYGPDVLAIPPWYFGGRVHGIWQLDCVCKCMPDDPQANCVRGCIQCAKENGADVSTVWTHKWCVGRCKEKKLWDYKHDSLLNDCIWKKCCVPGFMQAGS
jgi:RHS repeat-associated protein